MIAVREVRASDRSLKQDVADDRESRGRVDEYDMAGRMSGAVKHVEAVTADGDRVALFEPAVRQHVPHPREAVGPGLLFDPLKQEAVPLVWAYDRAGTIGAVAGCAPQQAIAQLRRAA